MIILLNGISSAGKSSIAREMQGISDKMWMHLGIDTFIEMTHPKFCELGDKAAEGFLFTQSKNTYGQFVTEITISPIAGKIVESIPETVELLSSKGLDIIVDECLLDNDIERYKETFQDKEICYVGVMCDLETLEKREKARGDRMLGLARGMFDRVHNNIEYNVIVETAKMDAISCAKKILAFIEKYRSHN